MSCVAHTDGAVLQRGDAAIATIEDLIERSRFYDAAAEPVYRESTITP